jgi:NADH-quinone oxidoreductase subunit B
MGIEGVLKEGFVTTSVDTLINWSKTGSLWPMTFGLACIISTVPHATTSTASACSSAPARARAT